LDGFRALLTRLDPDPARAWLAHEELRKKLIAYFEHNHHFEAEELAEEVLKRIARRPDLQTLKNVVQFAFGVARNLRKENFRKTSMRAEVLDMESIADQRGGGGSMEEALVNYISAKRKLQCFQRCIENLSAGEREIVRRYYPAENDDLEGRRLTLAADLGINVSALRTRIAGIKEKLQYDFNRHYYGEHRRRL
jgi:DNA-directed RNA polymerase specialized sigma24 family protein